MNRPFALGLRWKLNLLIGTILVVTMGLFVSLDLYHERKSLITSRSQQLEEIAQHFGWLVQSGHGQDPQSLVTDYEHSINSYKKSQYRVLLLNASSEVIASTNPRLKGTIMDEPSLLQRFAKEASDAPTKIFLEDTAEIVVTLPIVARSPKPNEMRTELTVLISAALDDIGDSLRTSLFTHTFHLLITAVAMTLAINLALSRMVLQPINKLLTGMKQMQQGEWTSNLPVKAKDEIGDLTQGYNALGRNLEQTVHQLVRAEKLASVALVAICLSRDLKKPIRKIREGIQFLSRQITFDVETARTVGCMLDQTDKMYAICEKFNEGFSKQVADSSAPQLNHSSPAPSATG